MILNALRISTHFVIHNILILNAVNIARMTLYSNTYVIDTEHITDIWPCVRTFITLVMNTSPVYGRTRARTCIHTHTHIRARTCTRGQVTHTRRHYGRWYAGTGTGKMDVTAPPGLNTGL